MMTVDEFGLIYALAQAACSGCLGIGRLNDGANWKETQRFSIS